MRIFANVKINEAIERFAEYVSAERRLAAGTVAYYVGEVRRFEAFAAQHEIEDLEEVEARDVRAWQMSLVESGEAPGTVVKQLAAMRAWFKFLRQRGMLDRDIMAKVSVPKVPKRLPIFFRENEAERIYDDIYPDNYSGEVDKLVLRLLYETGMRRSELAGLTLASVDLAGLMLKVRGKRNKERLIPIERELASNISRYMALREETERKAKAERAGYYESDILLLDRKGEPLSVRAIYGIVEHYMGQLSNADRTSPHIFRHSFATHLLNEGANIDAIRELLGHSSLNSTEIYTHVTREHLKETYKHAHPRANKK